MGAIWPALWAVSTSLVIRLQDSATVNLMSCHAVATNAETVSISFLHLASLARYASKRKLLLVVTNLYRVIFHFATPRD